MYFATRKFWTDLVERTVSTAAQSALGVVAAASFGLLELNSWKAVAAAAGGAALIAVLKAFSVARTDDLPK